MLIKFLILTNLLVMPLFAQNETVIAKALEARSRAYAPYSNYFVGAALETSDGEIIQGCNVENASYGCVICAERAAVVSAVSQGKRDFSKLVVATKDGGSPCGACRQVLNEFNPKLAVIIVDEKGAIIEETTLDRLLPQAFGPHNLE